MDSTIVRALSAAVTAALAVATDARAELGALLEEWEGARRDRPERLVSILSQ